MRLPTFADVLRPPFWCLAALSSAAFALTTLSGCSKKAGEGEAKSGGRPPTLVRVQPITKVEVAPKVIVVGTVTAKRKSIVASGANGVVEVYQVDEGEWVKTGDVLSVLRMETSRRQVAEARSVADEREQIWEETKSSRPEEIAEARYKMEAARKTHEAAERHEARMKAALQRGAINEDQYEDAQERHKVAEAMLQAAAASYQRIKLGPRKEQREQARYRYLAQQERVAYLVAEQAKRTTKAPFAGYVTREHSYVGQWLSKGDPVATLAMLDEVDVVVNVDQKDLHHVHLGETADVEIAGYELTAITNQKQQTLIGILRTESLDSIQLETADGKVHTIARSEVASREVRPWKGRILQVVPKSEWETGSRGFPVKVRIRNRFRMMTVESPDGKTPPRKRRMPVLKEGMIAAVTFKGTKFPTLLAPKDALVRTTQGMRMNIFRPSQESPDLGSTVQVTVRTGVSVGERIEVTVVPSGKGEPTEISEGTEVVTEGGERLLPVQGNVKAARETPSASN